MADVRRSALAALALVAALAVCNGCTYMSNRGNDALDMFDIGVTVTKTPHVAVYAGFQSLLGVGYSEIDEGHLLGIGGRHAGVMNMRYNAAGALLEGYQQYGYDGGYNPDDSQSPAKLGVGLGLIYHARPKSAMQMLHCPKFVHLLFIGVNVNCKIGEIADFLVGLTTLDIAGDDVHVNE